MNSSSNRRAWTTIAIMALIGVPGIVMRLNHIHTEPLLDAAIFGVAILSAAFLLSWAAEAAELEISQGLALAVIALIAVLPEYAVDAVLAWKAGADPAEAEKGLAIANMTGGNRLLIGLAWPLIFFLFFYRTRIRELVVDRQRALELVFLAIATIYVIFIPLRDHITLMDTVILVSMFIAYVYLTAKQESEGAELVGPAEAVGRLPRAQRRTAIIVFFLYAAAVIFASAEPFAEGLVETGEELGISEFFLIQWLAPLASESPEVLVASLLAWRGRASVGMGALLSSKVNQWTLLIGTLPLAFAISAGEFSFTSGLPLDARQREELFLTAAQSAFAVAVFINLKMSTKEAVLLFVLFATQLFLPHETKLGPWPIVVWYSAAYTAGCIILLIIHWTDVGPTVRTAWRLVRGQEVEPDAHEHGAGLEKTAGG